MKTVAKARLLAVIFLFSVVLATLAGCVTLGTRNPTATILFSNGKEVKVRLYYNKAPNTVKNFISLANAGFYNGKYVTRIIEYRLMQMGAENKEGAGDAGYFIKGEFKANGYSKNDLVHENGTLSMARFGSTADDSKYFDTASSQFYITLSINEELDGNYAVFGKVIEGLSYIEQISKMDVDENYLPRDEIYIKSITVDTYGKDYGAPKTIAK